MPIIMEHAVLYMPGLPLRALNTLSNLILPTSLYRCGNPHFINDEI